MQHSVNIPLYRLHNQRLSHNKFNEAAEVVQYLGAVQSQDFAGAKWAVGLRANGLTDLDVERAFNEGSILRTHLLRPTWHFVVPEDIRWLLALTAPRVRAQMAYMDRQLDLDKTLFKRSKAAFIKALRGGKQLTRAELELALQKARIPAEGQQLGHLLMHAELDGILCSGTRHGKPFTYALLEERVPPSKVLTREESLAQLVEIYFRTRGPATLQDFAWWSGLTLKDAKEGMNMVRSEFMSETIDDQTYWFADSKPPAVSTFPIVHLLPNYDEFVVGFKDRSAIGRVAGQAGIKKNDAALLANIILLNGQIIGGWRRTLGKIDVQVEASLLQKLGPAEEEALTGAIKQYGNFIGLPALATLKEYTSGQRKSRSFS